MRIHEAISHQMAKAKPLTESIVARAYFSVAVRASTSPITIELCPRLRVEILATSDPKAR